MMQAVFYVCFLLVFGSLNTLTTKWQFSMQSVGIDGVAKNFQKPWWGNFAMFAAMVVVMLVYLVEKRKQGVPDKKVPLLAKAVGAVPASQQSQALREFLLVGIPAVLDLVSSGLNFMGLLCISASVWQMLRGSMIVFSALLSIIFLGRTMYRFHWVGIGICVAGIFCVGAASVLGAEAVPVTDDSAPASNAGSPGVGVLLVMIAQVVQAGQCVAEEKLLKTINMPGTLLVAYEGIWGAGLMVAIVFPLLQLLPGNDVGGVQENTLDTLTMIENSFQLQMMLCIYLLSCSTYNVARMLVTSNLSAVHFTMIDASRTAIVWVLDLCLMYCSSLHLEAFGEKWTAYSPLQAVGFVLLLCGQTVYGGLLTLPIPSLYPEQMYVGDETYINSCASRHMATPLPPFSPPCQLEAQKKAASFDQLGQENPFVAV